MTITEDLLTSLRATAAQLRSLDFSHAQAGAFASAKGDKTAERAVALLDEAYDLLPSYLGNAGRDALHEGLEGSDGLPELATRIDNVLATWQLVHPLEPQQARRYFSERQGRGPRHEPLDDDELADFLKGLYDEFLGTGHFEQNLRSEAAMQRLIHRRIGHRHIWPLHSAPSIHQDAALDLIEFLCDLVSSGVQYNGNNWDPSDDGFSTFDPLLARAEFIVTVNEFFSGRLQPLTLGWDGLFHSSPASGFEGLTNAPFPTTTDPDLVVARVEAAKTTFFARGATREDLRSAVRDLAGVVEHYRDSVIKEHMLKGDEGLLFELANRFDVRHHRADQHSNYDHSTWLRWMFYVYLATVHALARVEARSTDQA